MTRLFLFSALALFTQLQFLRGATFNIANGDVAGLAAALYQSDHNLQDDTINLAANGTYILTSGSVADPNHSAGASGLYFRGDYDFDQNRSYDLTINGNNATIMRSTAAGTANFRLMEIRNAVPDSLTCHADINNVIFANGSLGGITFQESGYGGALFIEGGVTLTNCTIRDNTAYRGGGLFATLHAVLNNCTIMQNTATDSGGGIYTQSQLFVGTTVGHESSLSLTNCTVANNTAPTSGAGIFHQSVSGRPASVSLSGCTFSGNGTYSAGTPSSSTLSFKNTLFASSPVEVQVSGPTITSNGYNLTTATAQGYFTQSTDRWNADPKLDRNGPQMNGGPTPTIALCAGSDAIDHGSSSTFDFFDQRGFPRRVDNPSVPNTDDGTDIGAYEAAADPMQYGFPAFNVTTLADYDDGVCSGNDCTLREAIARVNNMGSFAEKISIPANLSGTLGLNGSELVITNYLTLTGPGARSLAISAQSLSRVFSIIGSVQVSISGLTIRDGLVSGSFGASTVGGGIYNEGYLFLFDCAVVHNRVAGGSGTNNSGQDGGMARGGGIFNGTSLTLARCTIGGADANSANGATGGTGAAHPSDGEINYTGGKGGAGLGGAIYNDTNGALTINNCTIAGNTAAGGAGGAAYIGGAGGEGTGGIYNAKTMTTTGTTISANSGNGGAGGRGQFTPNNGAAGRGIGGVHTTAGTATIRSSIIAANTHTQAGGIDVEGAFISSGFNLIGTASNATGFTNATDLAGTNTALIAPLLGPIQNNGGTTDTMALLAGSLALDRGNSFGLTSDQRGRAHSDDPILGNPAGGDGTDAGAYESSYARIIGVTRGGAAATITFIGTVGRQFQLQRRFSFTSAWTVDPNSQNTVLSAGQTMQLMDLHANDSPKIYYRIQEL